MYNLLIALAAALVGYGLGWVVAGSWIAGFVPAVLILAPVYFVLARRTGKQLEAIVAEAQKHLEAQRVDQAKKAFEKGLALGPWQFLVREQIELQLGALAYAQRQYKESRTHLERSWKRQWQGQGMLACLDHREKETVKGLDRLDAAKAGGAKDPMFWALYAYLAHEAGDDDRAIRGLSEGLASIPAHQGLKDLKDALANKKKFKMKAFAPAWYQFFPEQIPREELMAMAQGQQQRGRITFPQPRR